MLPPESAGFGTLGTAGAVADALAAVADWRAAKNARAGAPALTSGVMRASDMDRARLGAFGAGIRTRADARYGFLRPRPDAPVYFDDSPNDPQGSGHARSCAASERSLSPLYRGSQSEHHPQRVSNYISSNPMPAPPSLGQRAKKSAATLSTDALGKTDRTSLVTMSMIAPQGTTSAVTRLWAVVNAIERVCDSAAAPTAAAGAVGAAAAASDAHGQAHGHLHAHAPADDRSPAGVRRNTMLAALGKQLRDARLPRAGRVCAVILERLPLHGPENSFLAMRTVGRPVTHDVFVARPDLLAQLTMEPLTLASMRALEIDAAAEPHARHIKLPTFSGSGVASEHSYKAPSWSPYGTLMWWLYGSDCARANEWVRTAMARSPAGLPGAVVDLMLATARAEIRPTSGAAAAASPAARPVILHSREDVTRWGHRVLAESSPRRPFVEIGARLARAGSAELFRIGLEVAVDAWLNPDDVFVSSSSLLSAIASPGVNVVHMSGRRWDTMPSALASHKPTELLSMLSQLFTLRIVDVAATHGADSPTAAHAFRVINSDTHLAPTFVVALAGYLKPVAGGGRAPVVLRPQVQKRPSLLFLSLLEWLAAFQADSAENRALLQHVWRLRTVSQSQLGSNALLPSDPLAVAIRTEMDEEKDRLDPAVQARMRLVLKNYQHQAVRWMVEQEQSIHNINANFYLPLVLRTGQRVWASLHGQEVVEALPPAPRGGFLCEDMGLGKTIECIALVLANPRRERAGERAALAAGGDADAGGDDAIVGDTDGDGGGDDDAAPAGAKGKGAAAAAAARAGGDDEDEKSPTRGLTQFQIASQAEQQSLRGQTSASALLDRSAHISAAGLVSAYIGAFKPPGSKLSEFFQPSGDLKPCWLCQNPEAWPLLRAMGMATEGARDDDALARVQRQIDERIDAAVSARIIADAAEGTPAEAERAAEALALETTVAALESAMDEAQSSSYPYRSSLAAALEHAYSGGSSLVPGTFDSDPAAAKPADGAVPAAAAAVAAAKPAVVVKKPVSTGPKGKVAAAAAARMAAAAALHPPGSVWSRATLILVQPTTLGQWAREINNACLDPVPSVLQYYGSSRPHDPVVVADHDIVLTTYMIGTREATGLLRAINWHRIILDEGHVVKSTATTRSHALRALISRHRWIVTGTPYNKDINDIVGLTRFLSSAPPPSRLAIRGIPRRGLGPPAQGDLGISFYYDQLFRNATMRHSKTQTFQGEGRLTALPPRHVRRHEVVLLPEERSVYDRVYQEAKSRFAALDRSGLVRQKAFLISGMLLALRRTCSSGAFSLDTTLASAFFDPSLLEAVKAVAVARGPAAPIVVEKLSEAVEAAFNDADQCLVCLDVMTDPLVTPCNHLFCSRCIIELSKRQQQPQCPMCRAKYRPDQLQRAYIKPAIDPAAEASAAAASAAAAAAAEAASAAAADAPGNLRLVSKARSVLDKINELVTADAGVKIVVFTQFGECFDHMRGELDRNHIQYRYVSGDMTSTRRDKMVQSFIQTRGVTVFLLSIRTGAVGITLTAANHVIMMEPCMNRAHEEQAVNRVYRLGQTRDVYVHYMVAKDTIEEVIMTLNAERRSADGQLNDEAGGPAANATPAAAAAAAAAAAVAGAPAADAAAADSVMSRFSDSDYRRLFAR
jgi:SNF2 family DNA or RNA helicase